MRTLLNRTSSQFNEESKRNELQTADMLSLIQFCE